jgi:lysophospholipase L1-like esterase
MDMRRIGALVVAVAAAVALPALAEAAPKRVLVFGDSNTWRWMPKENVIPSERYPEDQRWPNVMQAALGGGYKVVVDALSGRTTGVADPSFPQLDGAGLDGDAYLPPAIAAHLPLDLVVVMLGTNDTKAMFRRSPFRITLGAAVLVDAVQRSGEMFGGGWYTYPAPKVLLVCPPPLGKLAGLTAEAFAGGEERSRGMPEAFRRIAEAAGVAFFGAGTAVQTDGVDGVHFTAATQRKLGEAVAAQVKAVLP